ncbi:TPA: hypothetical protein I7738_21865 [Vibrio vulnificus]|nr:hypothetical protein [Vibrio vulnificus]
MRFFYLLLLLISSNSIASSIYGYYSNVTSTNGEPSGYEILILDNGRGGLNHTSLLFQRFEGWASMPELVDCNKCTLEKISFVSKTMGVFEGKIENGQLVGRFVELNYYLQLSKSASFWQQ